MAKYRTKGRRKHKGGQARAMMWRHKGLVTIHRTRRSRLAYRESRRHRGEFKGILDLLGW